MKSFLRWLRKGTSQPSAQSLEGFLRSMNSIQQIQQTLDSPSGQQQMPSGSELSFTAFMGSFQDLTLTKLGHEMAEAQYRSFQAQQGCLPHRNYSPRLYWDGLEWVCCWGGSEPESKIEGRGENPHAALTDFDLKWMGATQ